MAIKTCLVSTLHDPDGKLQTAIDANYHRIWKLFNKSVVKITPQTKSKIKLPTAIVKNSDAARGRLFALENALELTDCDLFFYLDFDRLLYWYTVFPGEFTQVVKGLTNELTVIGRTKSAFESHPELQQLTERSCNLAFSEWYRKKVDILTGCRAIPRMIAEKIVKQSNPRNIAYADAEWLMIANESFRYLEVNGLCYEHSLFNIEKQGWLEIETRVNNLNAIMECVRDKSCSNH